MSHNPRSQPHEAAVAQLEAFRLSTYAARTFVALTSVGTATAKEVSEIAEVPRTRVYDAVEELRERGLVDIRQSKPQQFTAISPESLRRKLDGEYRHRLSVLTTALERLEPADRRSRREAIWTVDSREEIAARLLELITGANDEIVYLAADGSLSAELVGGLSRAATDGVSVTVGGTDEVIQQVRTEIPEADRIDPSPLLSMVTRFLLIDGRETLVGVRADDGNPDRETAIRGVGDQNSLVVLLTSLFGLDAES